MSMCEDELVSSDVSSGVRSSDGITKVNSDSLSSDPSQPIKSKEPTSASLASKAKSPTHLGSSSFPQKRNVETSSATISNNSIPGIRPKELRYPLDKYLPRTPKREETFIKSRENETLPVRKDFSLFRKIESLLKESQHIREPIVSCALPANDVCLNDSAVSSISTEDLVAAEFYKATYGTPKKADCVQKPNPVAAQRPSPNGGAGDWVEPRNVTHSCDPIPKPRQPEVDRDAGLQLAWGYQHVPTTSPIPPSTCHQARPHFDVCAHFTNASSEDFQRREAEGKQMPQKVKVSDVLSCSSGPSMSLTNSTRPKVRSLKRVTMQNACINTDRTNTHVFSIQHNETNLANDIASQNRVKSFIVQQLPQVSIRGRLVKQSCGIININPVNLTSEVQNTAVVEICREPDQYERVISSPKRQAEDPKNTRNETFVEDFCSVEDRVTQNGQHSENRQPALSHRLAFDEARRCFAAPKLKILDTAANFREKLSRDFYAGLEPIKRSLTAMVSSLDEFCQIGLNDRNVLKNLSTSSQANPQALHHRFDQMDDILIDELRSWGQRDLTHYNVLKTAIDDLTREIKTAVDSFLQMKSLNERTKIFLEGSTVSVQKALQQMNLTNVEQPSAESLRLDKLYAIHSFLQQSQDSAQGPQNSTESQQESGEEFQKKDDVIPEAKFGQTFTQRIWMVKIRIEHPVHDENDGIGTVVTPRSRDVEGKEKSRDYEDDFSPEDADQLSESSVAVTSTKSSSSNKNVEGEESHRSKVDEMVLRTSGSANGEESTDAPVGDTVVEERPSSAASTVNASQVNINQVSQTVKKPISQVCQSVPSNIVYPKMAAKAVECPEQDKPLVRLTNRSTNAVFEIRLPEQLGNLKSTLTYNSAGSNDQIQLSIGPGRDHVAPGVERPQISATNSGSAADILPSVARPQRIGPDSGNTAEIPPSVAILPNRNTAEPRVGMQDSAIPRAPPNISYDHLCGANLPVSHPNLTRGLNICPSGHITVSRNFVGENFHSCGSHTVQNQSTQFPSSEASVERLSASLLTLFESKINEMVETRKQTLLTEPKCKDVDVQVDGELVRTGPSVLNASSEPCTPVKRHALGGEPAQVTSDGYDSHTKHLERPSDYLLYRQTEKEVAKMLQQKSFCPIQMESSLSSLSVPTSPSEFPLKDGSTSSSELAFPLDVTPDMQRLNPVPTFEDANSSPGEATAEDEVEELDSVSNKEDSLVLSSHLHPNPNDVLVFQPEVENVLDDGQEAIQPEGAPPETRDVGVGDATKICNVQPYDSDLMSEGEVGYAVTSHSYSSGEIVERKKSKNAAENEVDVPPEAQENVILVRRVLPKDPGDLIDSTSSDTKGDSTSSESSTTDTS